MLSCSEGFRLPLGAIDRVRVRVGRLSCSEGFRLPLGAIDRVRARVGSELIVELYRGVSSSSRCHSSC